MKIIFKIFEIIINIIYLPFKCQKTKRKVTFISRQYNKPSVDYKLIKEGIEKTDENVECVFLCKKIDEGILGKFSYGINFVKQMKHIAQSKVVVIDGYSIAVSMLAHKKNLEIIQIWHSLGAIKEFGYMAVGKLEGSNETVVNGMKMHKGYSKILISSEAFRKIFAKGFNVSEKIMEVNPLPVVDLLRDRDYIKSQKEKITKEYSDIFDSEKLNIVYAPTFRKIEDDTKGVNLLISSLDFEKYNLVVKLHPLVNISDEIKKEGVLIDRKYSTQSMMMAGDIVITDYSAITYEAGILKKPTVFFPYDLENYIKTRGITLDYNKDMPGPVVIDEKNINEAIEDSLNEVYNIKQSDFTENYITLTDEKQSDKIGKRIVDLI